MPTISGCSLLALGVKKMSEDRLDRLEALADKILQGLDQVKQRTDSNARAIEALTNQWSQDRQQWEKDREQWEKDRKGFYLLLGRLTRSIITITNRINFNSL
jgi:phage regulator Rha-like protein